jgi:hypothetical protein
MRTSPVISKLVTFLCGLIVLSSCEHTPPPEPEPPSDKGTIGIRFLHMNGSAPLELDTMIYATDGDIVYKITDLQYFISGITLYIHGGGSLVLSDGDSIRYVDARMPETQTWLPAEAIPAVQYDSVAFIFGLDDRQNISNRFPNPPERDMFWPEVLGGGYHHMKLNSVWKNDSSNLDVPFMMHLGTGQIYSSPQPNPDSIIGFVPNWFRVSLPGSGFTMKADSTLVLEIKMHVDRWFNGPPNLLDLYALPEGIMQDEEAMGKVRDNGRGAFTINN